MRMRRVPVATKAHAPQLEHQAVTSTNHAGFARTRLVEARLAARQLNVDSAIELRHAAHERRRNDARQAVAACAARSAGHDYASAREGTHLIGQGR